MDLWIERRKKREKTIQRIIEFKKFFNLQQTGNFLVILMLAQKKTAIILEKKADSYVEPTYQDSLKKSKEAADAISEIIDHLYVDLKNSYRRYNELYMKIINKILEGWVTKENMQLYLEKITSSTLEITELIDSKFSNKLD